MPYLDTTRTSTLTMDYSFSIANRMYQPGYLIPPEDEYTFKNHNLTMSGHLGFLATVTIHIAAVPNSTDPPYAGGFNFSIPWNWKIYATINCNNGHGVNTTVNVDLHTFTGVSTSTNFIDFASTISGSLSCTVGTDVLWDVTVTGQTEPPTITTVTWPQPTAYRWYERATVGSTATTTLTVNSSYGAGGSGSHTATGTVASIRPPATYNAAIASSSTISSPISTSTTITVAEVKVNGKYVKTYTHSHSYGSQTASMFSMTLQSIAGSLYSATGTISTTSYLTRLVSLRGNYRAWKNAYTDVLRLNVYGFDYETSAYRALTSSSGAIGGVEPTDTLDYYSTTTVLNTGSSNTLTTALNQVPPLIYALTDTTDLIANGELATENRFLFRGWQFDGMTTVHDVNKSISISGLSNTYANNVNMSAYRYLLIDINSVGTTIGSLVITSMPGARTKQWNIALGNGNNVLLIDLCAPPLETASVDSQDVPLPRINPDMAHNATYVGTAQQDGPYWGITRVSSIVFTPASGASWTLNSLTLTRNARPDTTQNFVYTSRDYSVERITKAVVSEADTTTTFKCRRFWQQDSVARTEEESDVHWEITVGGATGVTVTTIFGRTIANLVDDINATDALSGYGGNVIRHNGWTATKSVAQPGGATCTVSQPPLRDCFLNGDTGYASWVYGGGILCTPTISPGTGTTFTYGFNIVPGLHKAQTLFDSINGDFIPDIDDPFNISTAGLSSGNPIFEGLILAGGNIFRGPAHGIVLNSGSTATPNVGATVDLIRTSNGAVRGTAITGTYGQFETDNPFAQNTIINFARFATLNITGTYHSSKRNRNAFRHTIATGDSLSSHNHDYSLMHLYSENSSVFSNRLTFYISPDNGATWNITDTGISTLSTASGGGHSTRLPFTADSRKIWLTYTPGGRTNPNQLITRYTENEGSTWSSVIVLANPAFRPTTCVGANGFEYLFYYTSNSTASALSIDSITRDTDSNVIQTAHTVVTTDAAFDTLAAYVRDTEIFLFYRKYTTNAVVVVKSIDMGNTYS